MENVAMIMIRRMLIVALVVLCVTGRHAHGQGVSVNEFTGTLNASVPVVVVPGPGGSGYAISLQYSSDVRPEDEASIVGFGWNMTVPAITRTKRGYPDDHSGAKVEFNNRTYVENTTWSVTGMVAPEALANDVFGLSGNLTVSYNTLTGWDFDIGISGRTRIKVSEGFGLGTGLGANTNGDVTLSLSGLFGGSKESSGQQSRYNSGVGLNLSSLWRSRGPFSSAYVPLEGSIWSFEGVLLLGSGTSGTQTGLNVTRTKIKPKSSYTIPIDGYMYAGDRGYSSETNRGQDYSVEKAHDFRESAASNLGVPIADFDLFNVSVPGIAGAFRYHHRLPYQVRPYDDRSQIGQQTVQYEVIASGGIGAGVPVVPGTGMTVAMEYDNGGNTLTVATDAVANGKRSGMWRYIGDMAGDVRYARDTAVIVPDMTKGLIASTVHPINRDAWPPSTNHIVHRTYGEIRAEIDDEGPRKPYLEDRVPKIPVTKSEPPVYPYDPVRYPRIAESLNRTIAEFIVTGGDGRTYQFSDPVYVTKESQWVSTLEQEVAKDRQDMVRRRIVYSGVGAGGLHLDEFDDDKTKRYRSEVGEDMLVPYVAQYLLSAILEPDYVDVTGDGPTPDDIGGYTVFDYETVHEQFRHRSPHNGYWYSPGSLVSMDDDQISYSASTSAVKVLREIRTRSHRAVFAYRGADDEDGPLRKDAVAAAPEGVTGTHAGQKGARGAQHMPYLASVTLYRLGIGTEEELLLSTRHFVYDYELMPDCPSCEAGSGRLTLKRTWTEERDVREPRIYPTEFVYDYPADLAGTTPKDVNAAGLIAAQMAHVPLSAPGLDANPPYDSERIDGWGQIRKAQSGGTSLTYDYTPDQVPSTTVDPAAYRLKQIIDAAGARTIVAYESHRYGHVQDKPAMMLVPLGASSTEGSSMVGGAMSSNKYVLRPDLIAPLTSDERTAMVDAIVRNHVSPYRRLYHRLAYDFATSPTVDVTCYVRGYSCVQQVATDGMSDVAVSLNGGDAPVTFSPIHTIAELRHLHRDEPIRLALDLMNEGVLGRQAPPSSSDVLAVGNHVMGQISNPAKGVGGDLGTKLTSLFQLVGANSFVRVPWPRDKMGGGVRVASVMRISPAGSLESDDAAMVGARYVYHDGVATNEPPVMREQNALVDIVPGDVNKEDRRTLGEIDIADAEGPVGETLMPSASVGYARVDVVSINDQASRPGFTTTSYRTARTHPPVRIHKSAVRQYLDKPSWFLGLCQIENYDATAVQGFSFVIADMHGMVTANEHWTGSPEQPGARVRGTYYDYNDPAEPLYIFDTLGVPLTMEYRGRTQDIVYEVKKHRQTYRSGTIFANVASSPLTFGVSPTWSWSDISLTTYVASKTTTLQPTLRTVTTVGDGMIDSIVTVAYERTTGQPAIVVGHDEFHGADQPGGVHNGTVTSIALPACRHYPELGLRSPYEDMTLYHTGSSSMNPPFGAMSITGATVSGTTRRLTLSPTAVGVSAQDQERRVAALRACYMVGDELELRNGVGALLGRMRIDDIDVNGLDVEITGTVAGAIDAVHNVRLSRSARQNQPFLPGSQLVLYGYDLGPALADARLLYDRQDKADRLNDYARNGYDGHENFLRWEHILAVNPDVFDITSDIVPMSLAMSEHVCPSAPTVYPYAMEVRRSGMDLVVQWKSGACAVPPACGCSERLPFLMIGTSTSQSSSMSVPYGSWNQFAITRDGYLAYGTIPSALGVDPATPTSDMLLFDIRNNVHITTPTDDDVHQPVTIGNGIEAPFAQVLSATAMIYRSSQGLGSTVFRLRPKTSYHYVREDAVPAQPGPTATTYDGAGTFPLEDVWNDWSDTTLHTLADVGGWVRGSIITHYDQHGGITELRGGTDLPMVTEWADDARRVRSVVAVAQATQTWSEDFETGIAGTTTSVAHTGRRAMEAPFASALTTGLGPHPTGRPYVVSFWVYRDDAADLDITSDIGISWGAGSASLTENDVVARVEGWDLVERVLPDGVAPASLQVTTSVGYDVFVDDLLIRPYESMAQRMVVDDAGDLRASLDDRGFAMIVQYDQRGRPSRSIGEFLTGRHTITDGQGHLPGRLRPWDTPVGGAYTTIGDMTSPVLMSAPPSLLRSVPSVLQRPALPQGVVPDGITLPPTGVGAAGDIIDATVSPDGSTIDVLGKDIRELLPTTNEKERP